MEFVYRGHSKHSGIYKITNKKNNKVYYGSCKEFKRRATQHLKALSIGNHANLYLLNAFRQDGSENFVFEVVEITNGTKEERLAIEQSYLDHFYDGQINCYNLRNKAISREGCQSKNPEQTKNLLSILNKNRIFTESHRLNLSKSKIGKPAWNKHKTYEELYGEEKAKKLKENHSNVMKGKFVSEKTRKKMSQGHKKIYEGFRLQSPDGTIYTKIDNLSIFAKINNLDCGALLKLIHGKFKQHKTWKLV